MLRVLLTNDDGIDAEGLQVLRRALVALDDVELAVIAPDGNRSATGLSGSAEVDQSRFSELEGIFAEPDNGLECGTCHDKLNGTFDVVSAVPSHDTGLP